MKLNKQGIVIGLLPLAGFVSNAVAQPYQVEASVTFAQFDVSFPGGGSNEGDVLALTGTYYLQIVDFTNGPLAERAFLDKSAYLQAGITQTKPDQGSDADTTGLGARFVTQEDLIIELGYDTTDTGSGDDSKTLELAVGKYLDSSSTAMFFYESEENGVDIDTIGGRYRGLLDDPAANTHVAYELELALVDAPNDSGFQIGIEGTYYPSLQLGVGASLVYLDVGDFDDTVLSFRVDNFFTDTVFAGLAYSQNSGSNDVDTDFLGVRVGARF